MKNTPTTIVAVPIHDEGVHTMAILSMEMIVMTGTTNPTITIMTTLEVARDLDTAHGPCLVLVLMEVASPRVMMAMQEHHTQHQECPFTTNMAIQASQHPTQALATPEALSAEWSRASTQVLTVRSLTQPR